MTRHLQLAADLALPIDAATQTFLIVGKRGSGKTTTCVRLAEQFYAAGVPFVVIDPVDAWYGLKSSANGTAPGLAVYIFGGRHADLPLEPTAGALIADVLIEHRISAILSIKHFSGRERGRFVAEFTARLFQKNTGARHLFLEEAHEVAPQQPFKGEEEMLGHVTRIWKLGRSSGLGGSAVTQRPASLSKNITTQAEILLVHRLLGPQDVAAVREWIRYHGEREDILAQLSTLKTGEAFIWAPDFPEAAPIGLKRIRILNRETFDSTATPRAGHESVQPKKLAPVDLARLSTQMAATVARAKADDPRELRRRIAELERALSAKQPAPAREVERVEVPVIDAKDLRNLAETVRTLTHDLDALRPLIDQAFTNGAERLKEVIRPLLGAIGPLQVRTASNPAHAPAKEPPGRPMPLPVASRGAVQPRNTVSLNRGERLILAAIAQYPAGAGRDQLTVLTGYRRSSRDTYLQRLLSQDLVQNNGSGLLLITEAGFRVLGNAYEPLPRGRALRHYWLEKLPRGERALFAIVLEAYPKALRRDELDQGSGYQRSSRDTYLQRLAARRLVTFPARGQVCAAAMLFESESGTSRKA